MTLVERMTSSHLDLRQSICRNLEMILACRRPMVELPALPATNALGQSLYGYGLSNLQGCRNAVQVHDVCRDLQHLVERFEPRLTSVVVELAKVDEQSNTLCFCIEANLRGGGDERDRFDTLIDLTSGAPAIGSHSQDHSRYE